MNYLIATRAATEEPRIGTWSLLGVRRLMSEASRSIGRAVWVGCSLLLSLWAILVLVFWLLIAVRAML